MVKLSSIFKIFILVCTLVMLRYLLLLPGDPWLSTNDERVLVAFMGAFLAIVSLLMVKGKRVRCYFLWLFKYLLPYLGVLVFSLIYTCVTYGYTIKSVLIIACPFVLVLFAFPLVYIFYCDGSCMRFLWVLSLVQLVMLIIKALAWYSYNFKGSSLFPKLFLEFNSFNSWIRNGLSRLEQGQLFGLVLVVVTFSGVCKGIRLKYLAVSLGMVCFVAFITMSRGQVVFSVLTVGMICYFANQKGISKFWLRLLLVLLVIAIFLSGGVSYLLESFSLTGLYRRSTIARLENVEHYFKILTEGHHIWGLGLLDVSNEAAYQLLYKRQNALYFLDDLGILGGVVRFGIFSLIIYGWLFLLVGKTCLKCYKSRYRQYFPLLIGIMVYMVTSCLLSNIFDSQRAYAVPFYLAVFSYVDALISEESYALEEG